MCAHFQGTSADASRIRRLTKAREEASAAAERVAQQVERELQSSSIREFGGSNRAAATADEAFRRDTVGLVTREDFVRHKATLDERIASEAEAARLSEEQAALRKRKLKLRRMKKDAMSKLSFADEEEDEDEEEGIAEVGKKQRTAEDTETCERDVRGGVDPAGPSVAGDRPGDAGASRRMGKNPLVDTSFLPDDERDKRERELREGLRKKWLAEQDRIKAEPVTITYSYWDGSGHRRTITVKKGDTVGQFLSAVRQQLQPEFREMRATSVENILYVKEDLILPHHFTFYDFILNKARGKSGPLFHFDVHEDVRMQADATVERDESHAGKVVERHWYEKNKHMFPASRWEVYDPKKSYGSYTIGERKKGDEVA